MRTASLTVLAASLIVLGTSANVPAPSTSGQSAAANRQSTAPTVLAVPGRTNSTPTVVADGTFVAVAWGATLPAGTTDIFAAVSRDGAQTFGAPVRVNDVDGDARVNGEQPPRVALVRRAGGDPALTVIWTTKGKSGTKLVTATSADGGRKFTAAATVPESDAASNRGWHNTLADRNGRVYTIWLDHREMADHSMGAAPKHEHGAASGPAPSKADGAVMAQKSKLYVGTIDGSVAPHPVTGGVCYCCKTAIAAGPDGAIYTAWRHVYPGNLRDIAFAVSRDGGRTFAPPVRVSEDRWMLEGCPDDGPAIAVDGRNRVHVVWPTLVTDEKTGEPSKAIFYATSADGRTFTARARVPAEGVANHPQIVIGADDLPALAWDESGRGARRVVVATLPSYTRTVVSGSTSGVYPSLATSGRGVVTAWTSTRPSGSVIRVERLP